MFVDKFECFQNHQYNKYNHIIKLLKTSQYFSILMSSSFVNTLDLHTQAKNRKKKSCKNSNTETRCKSSHHSFSIQYSSITI
jgi:hypothetical protein